MDLHKKRPQEVLKMATEKQLRAIYALARQLEVGEASEVITFIKETFPERMEQQVREGRDQDICGECGEFRCVCNGD